MATKYWQGQSIGVQQVTTVTVGGTLAGETFTISVGGIVIATHTDTDTVIATTVAALVSQWNGSTNIYATGVLAVDASPDITLTAGTGGIPFEITLNTPGGSATLGQAATTANAGPNVYDLATNWSDGLVPGAGDTIVFENSAVSVLWGLSNAGATLTECRIMQSYTGLIGLHHAKFQTSATTNSTILPEYRDDYLAIDCTLIRIGEHWGQGNPSGSQRIKIDSGTVQSTINVSNSASNSADGTLEPIRWKGTHIAGLLNIFKGRVGIATTSAGEAAIVAELNVSHLGNVANDAKVSVGPNVTLAAVNQSGGVMTIQTAGATLTQLAGTTRTTGTGAWTTVIVGGVFIGQSAGTITTLTIAADGKADFSQDARPKTITNIDIHKGGNLNIANGNPQSITMTNGVDLIRASDSDVTLDFGNHISIAVSAI